MVAIARTVASKYDSDKFGESNWPDVGKYHAIITKAEEPNDNGQALVDFDILSGTTPGQEGKTIGERFFPFSEKAASRLLHLFFISGAASEEQIHSGEDIPMSMLVGKQLFIDVVFQEGKPYTKDGVEKPGVDRNVVSWSGFGKLDDPDWKGVPKNQGAIDSGGIEDVPLDDASSAVSDGIDAAADDEDPFNM